MKLISIASLLLIVVVATVLVDAVDQTGDGGVKWQPNCDFYGGDIGNVRVPGEQCGRACINNDGCNHFVYKDGVCYLKKKHLMSIHTPCGECDVCGKFMGRRDGK
jgi:hypothetical protein